MKESHKTLAGTPAEIHHPDRTPAQFARRSRHRVQRKLPRKHLLQALATRRMRNAAAVKQISYSNGEAHYDSPWKYITIQTFLILRTNSFLPRVYNLLKLPCLSLVVWGANFSCRLHFQEQCLIPLIDQSSAAVFRTTDMHTIQEFNDAYFSMPSTSVLLYNIVIQVDITKIHYLELQWFCLKLFRIPTRSNSSYNLFLLTLYYPFKYALAVVTKVGFMRFGWITKEAKKKFMKFHSWCQTTFQFLTMLAWEARS